jgi:hypothetical protein
MSDPIALLQRVSERSAAHSSGIPRGSPPPQHRSEYRSFAVMRNAPMLDPAPSRLPGRRARKPRRSYTTPGDTIRMPIRAAAQTARR